MSDKSENGGCLDVIAMFIVILAVLTAIWFSGRHFYLLYWRVIRLERVTGIGPPPRSTSGEWWSPVDPDWINGENGIYGPPRK